MRARALDSAPHREGDSGGGEGLEKGYDSKWWEWYLRRCAPGGDLKGIKPPQAPK